MSYRAVKRLLGETSLERKCRLLFGGALMILIGSSFTVYQQLNQRIIGKQFRQRSQLLLSINLQARHWLKSLQPSAPEGEAVGPPPPALPEPFDPNRQLTGEDSQWNLQRIGELNSQFKPADLREFNWRFFRGGEGVPIDKGPADVMENEVWNLFHQKKVSEPEVRIDEKNEASGYMHFVPVIAESSCVECHRQFQPKLEVKGLIAIAKISFKLSEAREAVAQNNSVLIAMAIATGFLAMLVAWSIVRYVVVKPVQHLREVADAVAHGDLDQRAEIRTSDEFEELSHAFNRMLRHLVSTQDELRQANTNLDGKVDELAQANLSLHQMNRVKNEFLATMSHELRTPLNSILGFSEVLTGADNLSDRQKKYLTNIQSSGQNLLLLINDILDLAKIEAGKMELHLVDFAVADLIERLTTAMLPLAERKNIDLQWSVDPEVPRLHQDAGKLQQIIYNLLSNAVKFTPEGGRVRVSVSPAAPALAYDSPSGHGLNGPAPKLSAARFELVVADTGIGIPLEDQAMIFEKFRQGSNVPGQGDALAREYEGTGLGLSIVKELSRLLGGEVSLESEFGKGSVFTIRLPYVLEDQPFRREIETPRVETGRLEPLLPRRSRATVEDAR